MDKYTCVIVYYHCNNLKQQQILSRILSRITLKVLHANKYDAGITWQTRARQATTDGPIDLKVTILSNTDTM